MGKTVKTNEVEHSSQTVKDIQEEIKRLDKESDEYMLGIQEKKRELEGKLSEMLEDTIKSIRKNIGKIYMHTETRGKNWCETVIGVIHGATYDTIQFSKCIVFNNYNNSKCFEKHNRSYYANFEIANFEKGFYETKATTLWGTEIVRHFEIKELSEEEANSIVKEFIEIYKENKYSMIDEECNSYSKFISYMFNVECQYQESDEQGEDLVDEIDEDDCDLSEIKGVGVKSSYNM